jgi:hypothetical protein
MKYVQMNVEHRQLHEMATAFGARSLGTALVVHFDTMAVVERKTTASPASGSVEPADDYQSGPEHCAPKAPPI